METLTVDVDPDGTARVEVVARLVLAWLRRHPLADGATAR